MSHFDANPRDNLIGAAQDYLNAGLQVIPVDAAKKRPRGRWKHLQAAGTLQVEVDPGFEREGSGIAVVCGAVSGNLEVMDFDTKNEPQVDEPGRSVVCRFADKVRSEQPDLYRRLLWQQTPSGGFHALYRVKGPVGRSTRLAVAPNGRPVVETRGEGGYALLAPTPGYTFLHAREVDRLGVLTVEERDFLHGVAQALFAADQEPPGAEGEADTERDEGGNPDDDGDAVNRCSEEADTRNPPSGSEPGRMPVERVRALLGAIPRRPPYDEWIRIIAAVQAAVGDDDEAERLLIAWSPEEQEGEYRAKLESEFRNITAGTLVHIAREHGYDAGVGHGVEEPAAASTGGDDELDPGPFPVDSLPSAVRAVVENLAAACQVPVALPALVALAVLSTAAAKVFAVYGALPGVRTFLNTFTIVSAEKGSGKGRTVEALARPLHLLQGEVDQNWRRRAAELRARLRQLQGGRNQILSRIRSMSIPSVNDSRMLIEIEAEIPRIELEIEGGGKLLCEDVTSERFAVLLAANREFLASLSSEGSVVVEMLLGRYKERIDIDLYLKCYCGEPHSVERMGRPPVRLQEPRLTILWTVQGVVVEKLVGNPEILARGLTSRCIVVDTGAIRQFESDAPPAFTLADDWLQIVEPIGRLWLDSGDRTAQVLVCSAEAVLVFREFHNEGISLERRYSGRIHGIDGEFSRGRENAIKIAGLLALAMGERERIDEATALRACRVMRWCHCSYLRLRLGGARAAEEREVERLVMICGGPGGEISFGDLQRRHGIRAAKLERVRELAQRHPRVLEVRERVTRTKRATVLHALTNSKIVGKIGIIARGDGLNVK